MKKDNGHFKSNKAILDGITVGDIAEYLNRRPAEFAATVHEYHVPVEGERIRVVSVSKDLGFHVFNNIKKDYEKLRFSIGIETEKNSGNYGIAETEKYYEIGKDVAFGNDCGFYLRFHTTGMTKDEIIEGIIRSSDIKVFVHLGISVVGWSMLKRTENCEEVFVLEYRIKERQCELADINARLERLHEEAKDKNTEIDEMKRRMDELRAAN